MYGKRLHAPRVTLHRGTKRQTVRKRNPTVGARRNTIYDLFRLRDGRCPRLQLQGHTRRAASGGYPRLQQLGFVGAYSSQGLQLGEPAHIPPPLASASPQIPVQPVHSRYTLPALTAAGEPTNAAANVESLCIARRQCDDY